VTNKKSKLPKSPVGKRTKRLPLANVGCNQAEHQALKKAIAQGGCSECGHSPRTNSDGTCPILRDNPRCPRADFPEHVGGFKALAEPKIELEFERNIVFSTGHITKHDDELLTQDAKDGESTLLRQMNATLLVYKYLEGFFIYVPEDDVLVTEIVISARLRGYSEAFLNLVKTAFAHQCKFVHLDGDGLICPSFQRFEW
jgi:hypothetical protein